jgi:hypothetical protein
MQDRYNPYEPQSVQDHLWEEWEDLKEDYEVIEGAYQSLLDEVAGLYVDIFSGASLETVQTDFEDIFNEHGYFDTRERANIHDRTRKQSIEFRTQFFIDCGKEWTE